MASSVHGLVDHLFRHEAGKLTAVLTRLVGVERFDLVEDLVQETLLRALEAWRLKGVPDNPSAWLITTGKNRAYDRLRHLQVVQRAAPSLKAEQGGQWPPDARFDAHEVEDDVLRMMFSCCPPELGTPHSVVLILKVLCGFGVREIAQALLASEAAIEKRISRAKAALAASGELYEVAGAEALAPRLAAVQRAIYLLFSEGYHSTHPERAVREDLSAEAIRLGCLLADHPACGTPTTHALCALMALCAARLATRVDTEGALVLLQAQDRSRWDRALLGLGMQHLSRSAAGSELSPYHLQAGIAAQHALAPTWEATDWATIRRLYDALLALEPSAVVAINRAVAVAMHEGPEAGLSALDRVEARGGLQRWPFWHATRAELHRLAGDPEAARQGYAAAREHARNAAERAFYEARLAGLSAA